MNGGLRPLRDRRLATGFIVVIYLLVGATLAGLLATGLEHSQVGEAWPLSSARPSGSVSPCGVSDAPLRASVPMTVATRACSES